MAVVESRAQELKQRIENRTARVGIIGLGYVGLPLTLLFSEERFRVTGFDIDESKVQTLNGGGSYIVRIPPTEIARARATGFEATSDYDRLREMDVVLICVPTPLNEYHEPDLSFITDTVKALAPRLRAGQLIVLESTTYPGTTEEVVVPLLEKGNGTGLRVVGSGEGAGDVHVAFSPEREDPGNDTVARRDIPKVVGGVDPVATELGCS
ncbi:MAG TPA: NAD(P)-binding domain-containing protein, partial [Acidobacteriaceae bacterium]|nr:NAD(P)-binding domain-containing protein [Acidobacteriaceae bacterium]